MLTLLYQSDSKRIKTFSRILGKSEIVFNLPRPKREKKLPNVINMEEFWAILKAVKNLKHRAIILLTYSSGLRLSEVVNLKIKDIDVERGLIHIRQAKGRKDRYTVLSQAAWQIINVYINNFAPRDWLFPGANPEQHLSKRSVQKVLEQACLKAGLQKRFRPTHYDTVSLHIFWKAEPICDTFKSFWDMQARKLQRYTPM